MMRGLVAAGVVLALFLIIIGIASIANGIFGSTEDVGSGWAWGGALTALAGAAVLAGLLTSRRNPLLGISLVAAGAIIIAVVWYWALLFTIPVGITLVAIAFFRALADGLATRPRRRVTFLPKRM